MAKMNVQFHATLEDIYDFIVDMFSRKYIIKGIIIFPEFEIHDITEDIIMEDIKSYDIFCISKYEIIDIKSYKEFCKNRSNTIGIDIGTRKPSQTSITEMIMWIGSDNEIDSDFKKIINKFKRSMHRGAWGVCPGPNPEKYFYKNHLYTERAKIAYRQGVKLCAYGGWTYFELPDD